MRHAQRPPSFYGDSFPTTSHYRVTRSDKQLRTACFYQTSLSFDVIISENPTTLPDLLFQEQAYIHEQILSRENCPC